MQSNDPDEIINELRARASALGAWRIAAIVTGAVLIFFMLSTWFTVQPEETGIVQRFGAVNRTVGP